MDQPTLQTPPATPNGTVYAAGPAARRPDRRRTYALAALALLLLAGAAAYLLRPRPAPQITTAPVVRKALAAAVTATGTVNPQDTISVGAQVSGTIQAILADFNDPVRKGQVLVRLDPTTFQAALDQANGSLAQARAAWQAAQANAAAAASTALAAGDTAAASADNVRVAQAAEASADADVAKATAAAALATQTLARDRSLLAQGYIAQSQVDADASNAIAAQSALQSATVAARQARMQLSSAQNQAKATAAQRSASQSQAAGLAGSAAAAFAAIRTAQAQVAQAQQNLDHTVVTSPVDGTVIARNVSIGQTVAASFQTPTLFTIAKDLNKMEVDLAVGEPDVGNLRTGQPVSFTVLAFPGVTFHGTVAQIRINPTTIQNVVTYDTVVYADNADRRLRPGMTASAAIVTSHVDDALVVPLAALSFRPASAGPRPRGSGSPHPGAQSDWGNTGEAANATLQPGSSGSVAVLEAGKLRRVAVRVRLISAGEAAVEPLAGAGLAAGDAVAVSSSNGASEVVQRAPGMFR